MSANALAGRAQLAWFAIPIASVLAPMSIILNWGRPAFGMEPDIVLAGLSLTAGVMAIGLVVVGALIAARQPRNPIGWLLVPNGLLYVIAGVANGYGYRGISAGETLPAATMANWVGQWIVVSPYLLAGLVFLLFPDGRLPSQRWRWFVRGYVVFGVLFTVAVAAEAWPLRGQAAHDLGYALPFGGDIVTGIGWPVLVVLLAVSVGALVMRYRSGREHERAQLRWLTFAATVAILGLILLTLEQVPVVVALAVCAVAAPAAPAAIGVAVLRYRLYEIDRIISRTVTYTLVVSILGGVYAAGVIGLGTVVSAITGQEGSGLAVAASTLTAAALFRPVRSEVQRAVDRRFNRRGYESRQVVEAFAERLREEGDFKAIRWDLTRTAAAAVEPDHISVWLPRSQSTPAGARAPR